MIASHFRSQI